jgi:DNA-binding transcriptional regulator YhcF (GntR family)
MSSLSHQEREPTRTVRSSARADVSGHDSVYRMPGDLVDGRSAPASGALVSQASRNTRRCAPSCEGNLGVSNRGTFRAIADELRERISSRRDEASAELSGELALAEEFGVARGKIRAALAVLEDEGLIEVVPGHGRRVAGEEESAPGYERVAQSLRTHLAVGEF